MRAEKHLAFNVYRRGRIVDTVFWNPEFKPTTKEVQKSLIEHDGYPPDIIVRKARN